MTEEKVEITKNYETLDHTADIQFHSWGNTLKDAFESMALCMFDYVTEIEYVKIDDELTHEIEVSGQDLQELLYKYMDELLFEFSADGFTVRKITITTFDTKELKIVAKVEGETFDRNRHPIGTEIKAITFSNMQIHEKENRSDIFLIVDI